MHSLEDLESAKAALALADRRYSDYDGNNPNKHRTDVADAKEHLYRVEREVKRARLVPLSDDDELQLTLDETHPNAKSKTTVEFNGKRYIKSYRPGARTLSGNVRFWIESWTDIS